jgi:hypothetical protein
MVVAEALPMAVWFVDNQTVLKKLDRLESETGSDWRVKPRPRFFITHGSRSTASDTSSRSFPAISGAHGVERRLQLAPGMDRPLYLWLCLMLDVIFVVHVFHTRRPEPTTVSAMQYVSGLWSAEFCS